jgi:hypothetical protein
MRSPIWTLDEIHELPEFGAQNGWFYGLVRDHETGKVKIYEIFPGIGYADVGLYWCRRPRNLIWVIQDIWKATKRD